MAKRMARDRDGEASRNKQGRDKSIVPRLYATNPRYNVLLPHFPLGVARRRGAGGYTYHLTLATVLQIQAPLASIIPFLYRVALLRNNRLNEDTLLSL